MSCVSVIIREYTRSDFAREQFSGDPEGSIRPLNCERAKSERVYCRYEPIITLKITSSAVINRKLPIFLTFSKLTVSAMPTRSPHRVSVMAT